MSQKIAKKVKRKRSPTNSEQTNISSCDTTMDATNKIIEALQDIRNEMKLINEKVDTLNNNRADVAAAVTFVQKEQKRRNIIIHGVPEIETSVYELQGTVIEIMGDLDIKLKDLDIDVVMRMGRKLPENKHPRPIVLKLTTQRKKSIIMKKKSQLKSLPHRSNVHICKEYLKPKKHSELRMKRKHGMKLTSKPIGDANGTPKREQSSEPEST